MRGDAERGAFAAGAMLSPEAADRAHQSLDALWRDAPGILSWLRSVGHRSIGTRYAATALIFFLLGGINAGVMRLQLARPQGTVVSPERYSQLFSMHGSTMMFLFAVPAMTALGLYLVPLMIGTRDVAFPRLNAFGYWSYLIGGAFLYVAFLFGSAPNAGWVSYVPLSGPKFAAG